MSEPSQVFQLTVDENPQNDGAIVMSGEGITLQVTPAKTFITVIRGTKVTVTFEFNPILGKPQAHRLNK
jgi:hypothetical protein